ncbi:MAG TPA: dual specificity protein phosphatase family protein [Terriglobia bacterium]|nr:dual specificity protein phosphatase family protein [Terriglobia bacterium]
MNKRLYVSKYLAVATLLAVSSVLPMAAQTVTAVTAVSTHSTPAITLSSVHISNFGRINDNYYRGAQPKGSDYRDLSALGVKTIINLTSSDSQSDERAMAEQAGMNYVQIPMTTHVPPTQEQIKQFLSLVTDSASEPVYVHCVGGKHRTGVMTAVYRMTLNGWSADQAFKEMKEYKFGWEALHPEFKKFVYSYQPNHALTAKDVLSSSATTTGTK